MDVVRIGVRPYDSVSLSGLSFKNRIAFALLTSIFHIGGCPESVSGPGVDGLALEFEDQQESGWWMITFSEQVPEEAGVGGREVGDGVGSLPEY